MATTGTPSANASITATGRPSWLDASTNRSAPAISRWRVGPVAEEPEAVAEVELVVEGADLGLERTLPGGGEADRGARVDHSTAPAARRSG